MKYCLKYDIFFGLNFNMKFIGCWGGNVFIFGVIWNILFLFRFCGMCDDVIGDCIGILGIIGYLKNGL